MVQMTGQNIELLNNIDMLVAFGLVFMVKCNILVNFAMNLSVEFSVLG